MSDLLSLETNRRARVCFNWGLIKKLLETGTTYNEYTIKQGIPKDATILGVRNNNIGNNQDTIEVIIESETLDELQIDSKLPIYEILIKEKT